MGLRRKKRFTKSLAQGGNTQSWTRMGLRRNPWSKKETHNHGGGWVRKKKIPGFTDPWPKKKETHTIMEGGGGGTGKKEAKRHVQSLVSCRKSQS
jgi:hypothetical protein